MGFNYGWILCIKLLQILFVSYIGRKSQVSTSVIILTKFDAGGVIEEFLNFWCLIKKILRLNVYETFEEKFGVW